MKILHVLKEGLTDDAKPIIDAQQKENDVEIISLAGGEIDYDALVDKIEQTDKLITW